MDAPFDFQEAPMARRPDPFNARATLKTQHGEYTYYDLNALKRQGVGHVDRLPFSIKVLLEAMLRNVDGFIVTADDVAGLANWILIFVTQLRFRKRMQDRIGELKLKMPMFPAWSYLSIGALVCIILGFFFIPDFRYALILGPLWILSLYVAYRIKTKNEIRLTRDPGAAG